MDLHADGKLWMKQERKCSFRSSDDDDEHPHQKLIGLWQNFSSTFCHFLSYRAAASRTSDLKNHVEIERVHRGYTREATMENVICSQPDGDHFWSADVLVNVVTRTKRDDITSG